MPAATVGPPVPATAGKELRQALPPALVEALDKIGDQIQVEIIDPLLSTPSVEQLASTFERVFPKFQGLLLFDSPDYVGKPSGRPESVFCSYHIRSFQESEHLIRSSGPRWIGQVASLNALHGLAAVIRIAKATPIFFDTGRLHLNESDAESWANSILAYAMALSLVLASLKVLASGRTTSAKLDNVAALGALEQELRSAGIPPDKINGGF